MYLYVSIHFFHKDPVLFFSTTSAISTSSRLQWTVSGGQVAPPSDGRHLGVGSLGPQTLIKRCNVKWIYFEKSQSSCGQQSICVFGMSYIMLHRKKWWKNWWKMMKKKQKKLWMSRSGHVSHDRCGSQLGTNARDPGDHHVRPKDGQQVILYVQMC